MTQNQTAKGTTMTAAEIKSLCPKVKSAAAPEGVMVNGHLAVIVKTARREYHLGEMGGDWLLHGTAEQIAARLNR